MTHLSNTPQKNLKVGDKLMKTEYIIDLCKLTGNDQFIIIKNIDYTKKGWIKINGNTAKSPNTPFYE